MDWRTPRIRKLLAIQNLLRGRAGKPINLIGIKK